MGNVVSMGQSCDFLLTRAARHRRAGRYDEAMALLSRAKEQFGFREDIELESAFVYEAIGCDEDAQRAYLRVVRMGGSHQAAALYHLAVLTAARADFKRAKSYFQRFAGLEQEEISKESVDALRERLIHEEKKNDSCSRRGRVRRLERRAAACLQAGRTAAAERDMRHVIALAPSAQRFTLFACCLMLRGKNSEAIEYAEMAHEIAPSRVQTICVLADTCASAGRYTRARRWVYLAAMRARDIDDQFSAAVEAAKCSEDRLTVCLTRTILKRNPFFVPAMLLQACALTNLGRLNEASSMFARVSGLRPEDIVSRIYYRMTKEGKQPEERLLIGAELASREGIEVAKRLLAHLYDDPDTLRADSGLMRLICARCHWTIRTPMAGKQIKTAALVLLSTLDRDEAEAVLLDSLVDPQVSDGFKAAILQVMTSKHGFQPYDVDFGGRFVRLAAGGISSQPVRSKDINQRIVQQVADALAPCFPDAAEVLLPVYLAYSNWYGNPKRRYESACAAALEYVYHLKAGREICLSHIAVRYHVPRRLCAMFVRRLLKRQPIESDRPIGGDYHELH